MKATLITETKKTTDGQKEAWREELKALFGVFPITGMEFKKNMLHHSKGIFILPREHYISGGIIFMKESTPGTAQSNPFPGKIIIVHQCKRQMAGMAFGIAGIAEVISGERGGIGKLATMSLTETAFQVFNPKDIINIDFHHTMCDNPECENCVEKRKKGETNPYIFQIVTVTSRHNLHLETFEQCIELSQDFMNAK